MIWWDKRELKMQIDLTAGSDGLCENNIHTTSSRLNV